MVAQPMELSRGEVIWREAGFPDVRKDPSLLLRNGILVSLPLIGTNI